MKTVFFLEKGSSHNKYAKKVINKLLKVFEFFFHENRLPHPHSEKFEEVSETKLKKNICDELRL